MHNYCFSDYIYKLLGFNEVETKLILARNKDLTGINNSNFVLKKQRYQGLNSIETSLAEQTDQEFGHLLNPGRKFCGK